METRALQGYRRPALTAVRQTRALGAERLDWYSTVFELIDMRSFSNLWYWIALAVTWSSVTHWSLGVPHDMVQRARRIGGQAEADLDDLARINVNRLLYIGRVSGLWLLGLTCFLLSGLTVLAFWYGVEFAQAVLMLAFPLSLVGALSLSTAKLIESEDARGAALRRRLGRHRLYTQLLGAVSIFVTAMWGMYRNLTIGVLGG